MLSALLDEGEAPVGRLAEAAGLSRAGVYRALAELRRAGLVEYRGGVARVASLELQQLLKRVRAKYDLSSLLVVGREVKARVRQLGLEYLVGRALEMGHPHGDHPTGILGR